MVVMFLGQGCLVNKEPTMKPDEAKKLYESKIEPIIDELMDAAEEHGLIVMTCIGIKLTNNSHACCNTIYNPNDDTLPSAYKLVSNILSTEPGKMEDHFNRLYPKETWVTKGKHE